MPYSIAIFDLDGTTLNTLDDLAFSCNEALTSLGCPTRSTEEVRRFIGNGAAKLMTLALPEGADAEQITAAIEAFRKSYQHHSEDRTAPYPGIADMMRRLRRSGVRVCVNSNKPNAFTRSLCEKHFPGLIDACLGERQDIPKKPSPEGVLRLLSELGETRDNAVYIGDSDVDLKTAANAGIPCAWVSWGFRRLDELAPLRPEHRFDTVDALTDFLLS